MEPMKKGNRPCNSEAAIFLVIITVLIVFVLTALVMTGCTQTTAPGGVNPDKPARSVSDTIEYDRVEIDHQDSTISFVKEHKKYDEYTVYEISSWKDVGIKNGDTLYSYNCVCDTITDTYDPGTSSILACRCDRYWKNAGFMGGFEEW